MCSSALNSVSFFRSPRVILTGAGRGVRERGQGAVTEGMGWRGHQEAGEGTSTRSLESC